MDILDVLVTIVIIAVVLVSEVVKIKKKMASISPQNSIKVDEQEEGEFTPSDVDYFAQRESVKNEKFNPKSSKSMPYFTYEDVSGTEAVDLETIEETPSVSPKIQIQEIENETETLDINLDNPEELRKAVIYGEILKNPYN